MRMEKFLALFSIILMSVTVQAEDTPFLVCQRPIVQQAIALARNTSLAASYKLKSRDTLRTSDLRLDLSAIELLETKVFNKKIFNLQYDVVEGASLSYSKGYTPTIYIYQDTITDLNRLEKPELAHLFTVAHEMGHMVQAMWQEKDPKKLTPHGLVALTGNSDDYNIWHSETDCIGVELMHQAGVRDFSQVIPTLDSIRSECYALREKSFCDHAFEIRSRSVQEYVKNNPQLMEP